MNARIQELAEQAGLAYKTPNGKYWIDAGYPDIHLERFAELVRQDEREACLVILETYPTVLEMIKAIRGRTE